MSLYEIPSPATTELPVISTALRAIMVGSGNHNVGFFILGSGTSTEVNNSLFKSTMIAIIEPQNAVAQGASVVLTSIVAGKLTVSHDASTSNAKVGFLVFEATEF